MRKTLFGLIFALAAGPALAADPPPPDAAAAQTRAQAEQQRQILCAKVACRKPGGQIDLRMPDGTNFHITMQPLPFLDDAGTLILFAGESVTLSYAPDDLKLEHPLVSAASGAADPSLLAPASPKTISFEFKQEDGKPDMQLMITNTTAAMVKYDLVMLMPNPATGGARGGRTSACPMMPPQGNLPAFLGVEAWRQPLVLLRITNIRALPPGSPMTCN